MAKWVGNQATWSFVRINGASVLHYGPGLGAAPARVDVGKDPPGPAASRVFRSGQRSECQPAEIPRAKNLPG